MLQKYEIKNHFLLIKNENEEFEENLKSIKWLDFFDPNEEEKNVLKKLINQNTHFGEDGELEDLEHSARFFYDDNDLTLHSFFLIPNEQNEGHSHLISTVKFNILNKDQLLTLREQDNSLFRLYRMRSRHLKLLDGNVYEILLDLLELKTEHLADLIEEVYSKLETLSEIILKTTNESHLNQLHKNERKQIKKQTIKNLEKALMSLTELEDLSSKIRICLMDSQRGLNFLIRRGDLPNNQLLQAREALKDVESLQPHNEALFQKVNFLMQVALGFINLDQNKIMKLFSAISAIFLPATLVASTYGMNFQFMPELNFKYGYPMALSFMLCAGIIPFLYFKRKGWL